MEDNIRYLNVKLKDTKARYLISFLNSDVAKYNFELFFESIKYYGPIL